MAFVRFPLWEIPIPPLCVSAKMVSQQLLEKLSPKAGDSGREDRKNLIHQTKSSWLQTLTSLDHEDDDPGTVWNKEEIGRASCRERV